MFPVTPVLAPASTRGHGGRPEAALRRHFGGRLSCSLFVLDAGRRSRRSSASRRRRRRASRCATRRAGKRPAAASLPYHRDREPTGAACVRLTDAACRSGKCAWCAAPRAHAVRNGDLSTRLPTAHAHLLRRPREPWRPVRSSAERDRAGHHRGPHQGGRLQGARHTTTPPPPF